ncbi:lactase/phlorizin hydrolase-like [Diorhabda sublineata]|uniref:lactase/phlorizin hydrolase-like n=1 Tax=Diorhabda sublineata TaxID=1163346 RepID=UPI0024E0F0AA|nr:lactase/phlorizin hydrolase-like [Diorhabda sublineata]
MFSVKNFVLHYLMLYVSYTCGALNNKRFPDNFLFGTATASYQVEGAWNIDGKGENNWDKVTHSTPSPVRENATGDIACDSYHKYREDVDILKTLGVNHYRFSISWSRILPTGFTNKINQDGLTYYANLIEKLKENDIEPVITIFHWDTPQDLENIGGWTNEVIIDLFEKYAELLFKTYGNDVKYWITFNEPKQTCQGGYGSGEMAPVIKSPGIGEYMCVHNVLKAHAKVWHVYNDQFRENQKGHVGITIDTQWAEPNSNIEEDVQAAERFLQFTFGWYANPIINGDYPEVMKKLIADRSEKQGFEKSRLPVFTDEQVEFIKGTADFLGVNYYTTRMVQHTTDPQTMVYDWIADMEIHSYQKDEWPSTASNWLKIVPWGFRKLMNWLKATYGDIPILITENGVSEDGSSLEDDIRIYYFQEHLSNLRDALDDGVNIFGYTAWSLMDNFEWMKGYTEKFGIYSVNFSSPNRIRTPKKSADYFKYVMRTRCLVQESDCVDSV